MRRNAESRAVEDARPPSAWILVSVAGATLWITQRLAIWAIALQVLAILYSLLWRGRSQAWRSSGIVLNFGMFGIVGATIVLALRGYPAILSLAHFAALTQGLQLLDTRPRKSEFLLVALALFQVILAANLTDSVFFPPLLTTDGQLIAEKTMTGTSLMGNKDRNYEGHSCKINIKHRTSNIQYRIKKMIGYYQNRSARPKHRLTSLLPTLQTWPPHRPIRQGSQLRHAAPPPSWIRQRRYRVVRYGRGPRQ